jgi:CO/xanthine dehydrogenase Mo-binding subunit
MTTRYFGAPIARNEDRRLLTGQALFVNDIERPGLLHDSRFTDILEIPLDPGRLWELAGRAR